MTSKADQDRLDAIHDMPCVCCESLRIEQPFRTEAHHVVDLGYRKHSGGHQSTLPLDSWHHRGLCLDGMTATQMEAKYGPSLALNKRLFKVVFGTERELLEQVNEEIILHPHSAMPTTA